MQGMLESFASQIVIRVISCARQLFSHLREFFRIFCEPVKSNEQHLRVQGRLFVPLIKSLCTCRALVERHIILTVLVGYMARGLYSTAFSFRPFLYSCPLEFVYFYSYQLNLLCVRCAEGSAFRFLDSNWN